MPSTGCVAGTGMLCWRRRVLLSLLLPASPMSLLLPLLGLLASAQAAELPPPPSPSEEAGGAVRPEVSSFNLDLVSYEGSGSQAAVNTVVRRYAGQLRYCLERTLGDTAGLTPGFEATVQVEQGRATVATSTHEAESLRSCVDKKLQRWRYPAEVAGTLTLRATWEVSEGEPMTTGAGPLPGDLGPAPRP